MKRNRKSLNWLYSELPDLVAGGVLDADTAKRIRGHYGEVPEKASGAKIAVILFSILGSLMIGVGIILVLGHN